MRIDLEDRLPELGCKTAVIYGSRDAMAVAGAARFKHLPQVEFKVLSGVGHEVFIEEPQGSFDAIRAFLADNADGHQVHS